MNCPNCGRPRTQGAPECAHCGVIFSKWVSRSAPAAAETPIEGPPRLTLKALLPWSEERTVFVVNLWAWILERTTGVKAPRLAQPGLAPPIPPKILPVTVMRLWATFWCGGSTLGFLASEGIHFGPCAVLAAVGLLWFPWKPVRVLAAIALVPLSAAVGQLVLVILLVGGPDGRGAGSWLGLPFSILVLTVLGALLGLCVAELRSPPEPETPAPMNR